jgi:N,N'-diacetylbacillosaminyl-diphospho-undecaprenol alpha-1,3-N-acetylgalactosaminyltransferase
MKIAIISNTDWYIWQFRKRLLKFLKEKGHAVFAISPKGNYVRLIESLGAVHIPITIAGKSMNPLKDLQILMDLYKIFRREKFDLIHTFTIKPNIYGAIAGRLAGIPVVISSVVGLGYIFSKSNNNLKTRFVNIIATYLYKFAFRYSSCVLFQNQDDLEFFVSRRLIDRRKTQIIKSSGVNLTEYSPFVMDSVTINRFKQELSIDSNKVVITMVSRLMWEKGVREFIEAAKILTDKYPEAFFLLVGGIDKENPSAISENYLREAEYNRYIKWLGHRDDVANILAISDIVTLPSYYREGVPKVILEAMAMGKPIVTTNNVGCKDTVEEGKNGFLVQVKDPVDLAEGIERLIKNKSMRINFGKHSRQLAEREFDENIVIDKTIKIYEALIRKG